MNFNKIHDMTRYNDMNQHTMNEMRNCYDVNTATHRKMRSLRYTFIFLLMVISGCMNRICGQVSDGIYYIKIDNDKYLWPSLTEKAAGQPYLSALLTTSYNQTFNNASYNGVTYNGTYSFNSAYCSWVIKKDENSSYYILINVGTNQYVVWDSSTSGTGRAVHLESEVPANNQYLYSIHKDGNNYYIHPSTVTDNNTLGFNYKSGWNNNDLLSSFIFP